MQRGRAVGGVKARKTSICVAGEGWRTGGINALEYWMAVAFTCITEGVCGKGNGARGDYFRHVRILWDWQSFLLIQTCYGDYACC